MPENLRPDAAQCRIGQATLIIGQSVDPKVAIELAPR